MERDLLSGEHVRDSFTLPGSPDEGDCEGSKSGPRGNISVGRPPEEPIGMLTGRSPSLGRSQFALHLKVKVTFHRFPGCLRWGGEQEA